MRSISGPSIPDPGRVRNSLELAHNGSRICGEIDELIPSSVMTEAFACSPHSRLARLAVMSLLVVGLRATGRRRSSIVGVQSEPMGGVVSSLHIVVEVGGVATTDEVIKPANGSLVGFPAAVGKAAGRDRRPRIGCRGTGRGLRCRQPVRRADADAPREGSFCPRSAGADARSSSESRCLVYPPPPRRRGAVPGPLSGPTCKAPLTCIKGLCQSEVVQPAGLEPYTVDWPKNAPDVCKPRNSGPSTIQIGTGQTGFTPLATGQTLRAEAGPQGGHHIWVAVRMKNMKQAGSTTQISRPVQPDTGTVIPPSTFAFTFDRDEGVYCKLFGLRYQLDNGGIDYTQFLGKPLDVTTVVTDSLGEKATSSAHIQIAPTLVNP